jgi:thioesterase domain-containing protein
MASDRPADYYLGDVLLRSPRERLDYVLTRIRNIGGRGVRLARRALGTFRPSLLDEGTLPRALQRIGAANARAERSYVPRPYDGRIHLFWCSELPVRAYQDRRLSWSDVALDGLETHVIPGNHMSMVEEPHVHVLAAKLRASLDRTDGRIGHEATR